MLEVPRGKIYPLLAPSTPIEREKEERERETETETPEETDGKRRRDEESLAEFLTIPVCDGGEERGLY